MANVVKYSTTTPSNAIRKGNVALGINSVEYGTTANTNWYNGITPASGKYVIYEAVGAGSPNIWCPQNDTELYTLVLNKGGAAANIASTSSALSWIDGQPSLMATNFDYENIVTNGLTINLDAGFVGSYPTTGTSIYDLSGNAVNGTLTNSPAFNSSNSGSLLFNGSNK